MKNLQFVLLLALISTISAQTKSNYQIILEQIPESVTLVAEASGNSKTTMNVVVPPSMNVLGNRALSSAKEINSNIISGTFEAEKNIIYTLENIEINYGEAFRKSFMGSYYSERQITLSGVNILEQGENTETYEFNLVKKDTVLFDELADLEERGLLFTKGNRPEEPFMRSIVEPLVAVTAAIITVYLFFDVRSK